MSIPSEIRATIRERVWNAAEVAEWETLSNLERSRYYDRWTEAFNIGGVLQNYIDASQVRVYIKDTLLKGYSQAKLNDPVRVKRILRLSLGLVVEATFRKPHGQLLSDGSVIAWGRAEDWRVIILAVYERAFAKPNRRAGAAVLFNTSGRFDAIKPVAEDLARRLEVGRTIWVD